MNDAGPPTIISFRHLLSGEVERFLREDGLCFQDAVPAIGELMIQLSRYREEGMPLFPEVFLCDDLARTMGCLGGFDAIEVGQAPLDPDGIRGALKRAAPLGGPGWSIFLRRDGASFHYGVFRTDLFVLHPTAMDRLRALRDPELRVIGFAQLEENVIELRTASGAMRRVDFSGARYDAEPAPALVERLVARIGSGESREALRGFWRHVLIDELRVAHGLLLAVVRRDEDVRAHFADAAHLDPPIDVDAHVRAYLADHDEHARAGVAAAAALVRRMLHTDGITIITEDGAVVAYAAFIAHRPRAPGGAAGGARRRTYAALASEVGTGLVAAFFRSQDGAAELTM